MFTIITANALLVWFVWASVWPWDGCLALGSWNGSRDGVARASPRKTRALNTHARLPRLRRGSGTT
jgi:hypothetical protein